MITSHEAVEAAYEAAANFPINDTPEILTNEEAAKLRATLYRLHDLASILDYKIKAGQIAALQVQADEKCLLAIARRAQSDEV